MIVTTLNDCLRIQDSLLITLSIGLSQQLDNNITNYPVLFQDTINNHKMLFDLKQGKLFQNLTGISLFYEQNIKAFGNQLHNYINNKDTDIPFICILQQETQYNMQRINYIFNQDTYEMPDIKQCEKDIKTSFSSINQKLNSYQSYYWHQSDQAISQDQDKFQYKGKLKVYQCICNSGNMNNLIQQIKTSMQLSIQHKIPICIIVNFRDFLCSNDLVQQSNVYSQMYQMSAKRSIKQQYSDKTPSQQSKHITQLLRTKYKSINAQNLAKLLNKSSKSNKLKLSYIKDIVLKDKKDIEYTDKYCSYKQEDIFDKFVQTTLYYYKDSRELFGQLFDFSSPSSSFLSPFISLGVVSTIQLFAELDVNNPGKSLKKLLNKIQQDKKMNIQQLKESIVKYQQELLWNDFCHYYWLTNRQQLIKESNILSIDLKSGGLYDRKRKWKQSDKLLQQFEYGQLDDKYDLVNAAMNQLRIQGYMSNYLRMIVASCAMQLLLDWRDILLLFEKYLIDINWSSNLYGWLFSYNLTAGQPHTFNIEKQTVKRDKQGIYKSKWLVK